MNKPNLFVPGFGKSGTSSLYSMLIKHFDIDGPVNKEPHSYSRNYRFNKRWEKGASHSFWRLYGKCNSRYTIDASTSYIVSPLALNRIINETPDAKFIILARDPIERIISHYNWLSSLGHVNKTFLNELKKHGSTPFDESVHYGGNYKNYFSFSRYGEHIFNARKILGQDRILLIKYEDLRDCWNQVANRIWTFLDIPRVEIPLVHTNKTVQKRDLVDRTSSARLINLGRGLMKREYNLIKHGIPRSKLVLNPKFSKAVPTDEDYEYLIKNLSEDLSVFQDLGYDLEKWETTQMALKNYRK